VVSLLGIRHVVVGWTVDERGREGELAACGRVIFTTVKESEDTIECMICRAESR